MRLKITFKTATIVSFMITYIITLVTRVIYMKKPGLFKASEVN
jgi:hypothetical protein